MSERGNMYKVLHTVAKGKRWLIDLTCIIYIHDDLTIERVSCRFAQVLEGDQEAKVSRDRRVANRFEELRSEQR